MATNHYDSDCQSYTLTRQMLAEVVCHPNPSAFSNAAAGRGLFTSVGRAYLAAIPMDEREIMLSHLRSSSAWKATLRSELSSAFRQFKRKGFCLIERSCGQQVAVGISIHLKADALYTLGIGYRVAKQNDATLVPKNILAAIGEIRNSIDRFENTY